MAFHSFAALLCLVCPLLERTGAEMHIVAQTTADGQLEIYCLISDPDKSVTLSYKTEEGGSTLSDLEPSNKWAMNDRDFSVTVFKGNGSGSYQCSSGEEKSLFVFLEVDGGSAESNLSSLSCSAGAPSKGTAVEIICLKEGNLSFFRSVDLGTHSLDCDATKPGSASCDIGFPLQGYLNRSKDSVHVVVSAMPYPYSFVCFSKDGPFQVVREETTVTWRANRSAKFEMKCTMKTPFGQANVVQFVIADYRIRFLCLLAYVVLSFCVFLVVLGLLCRKQHRIRKMRHVYATFNASLSRSSDTPQRDLSRRPTRSLPPIPSSKPTSDNILYANAHLRLSQNSMPTRVRHSMFSLSSDIVEAQLSNRNSLPLHASNVSAQNALYFFTDPADDVSPKDTTPKSGQAFTFPVALGKSPSPASSCTGGPKSHTIDCRSSSLEDKRRDSDYQNWFQQYELSTSCPTIDTIEEGQEGRELPPDQVKSQVKIRHKSERQKRRSLIRNRLSSACKDHTLPRRKLTSLRRPISEYLIQPENPYVDRGAGTSCYSK